MAVLCFHATALEGGFLGVDLFFVLSGFLITALMLAERDASGKISIGAFYVRRAYRLLPASLAYIAIGTVLFGLLRSGAKRVEFFQSAVTSLLYVNDYYRVRHPEGGGVWLAHVWSLSLEEQFYLLWPLLLTLLCSRPKLRRWLPIVLLMATVGIAVWRLVLIAKGVASWRIYFALDTRADALLIGCALASWRHDSFGGSASQASFDGPAGRWLSAGGTLALLVMGWLAVTAPASHGPITWLDRGGYTLVALLGALVILSIDRGRPAAWTKLFASRPLVRLGKTSYGIYLWHYPIVSFLNPLSPRLGRAMSALIAAVVAVGIAELSYRLVETPIQRRRPAWAKNPAGAAPVVN